MTAEQLIEVKKYINDLEPFKNGHLTAISKSKVTDGCYHFRVEIYETLTTFRFNDVQLAASFEIKFPEVLAYFIIDQNRLILTLF